jgi:hypothetical protein
MKRLLIALVAITAMTTSMGSIAGAGSPGDFDDVVGHWVGIDAEGSFWRMSFGAQGNFNSVDSSTFPCESSRTRLWGDTTGADDNLYVVDFSLRCLNGPLSGTVIPSFGEFEFTYDPGTNTLILDQPDPFDDSVFCRRPCDPYVYFSG